MRRSAQFERGLEPRDYMLALHSTHSRQKSVRNLLVIPSKEADSMFAPSQLCRHNQPFAALISAAHMLVVERGYGIDCIDFCNRLVVANADDPGETKRIAAGMTVAFLYSVECDFDNDDRLNQAKAAEVLNRVLLEEPGHLGDFKIGQTGIGLAD